VASPRAGFCHADAGAGDWIDRGSGLLLMVTKVKAIFGYDALDAFGCTARARRLVPAYGVSHSKYHPIFAPAKPWRAMAWAGGQSTRGILIAGDLRWGVDCAAKNLD